MRVRGQAGLGLRWEIKLGPQQEVKCKADWDTALGGAGFKAFKPKLR